MHVINGDNDNLESKLAKALFGSDQKEIERIAEELNLSRSREKNCLCLIIDNSKKLTHNIFKTV